MQNNSKHKIFRSLLFPLYDTPNYRDYLCTYILSIYEVRKSHNVTGFTKSIPNGTRTEIQFNT